MFLTTFLQDWGPDDDHPVGGYQRDHLLHGHHILGVGVEPGTGPGAHPGVLGAAGPGHAVHRGPQVTLAPR